MSNNNYGDYLENQKNLIVSLFAEQELIPTIASFLSVDDFTDDNYKTIYSALTTLYDVKKETKIERSHIYSWALEYDTPPNVETLGLLGDYAIDSPVSIGQLVKRQSAQHKAKILLNETLAELEKDNFSAVSVLSKTETEISTIIDSMIVDRTKKDFSEEISDFQDLINQEKEEEVDTIPLFYKSLEKTLRGGWKKQQLITVGGRTGQGKSVIAVNSAIAALNAERSVMYFSLEMSKQELMTRMLAVQSDVILSKLEPGKERSDSEKERIEIAVNEMKNWKLNIDDNADINIEEISAKAKLQAQSKDGLDFIIIDYLQLINPSPMSARLPRQEQVAELSRSMKKLAKNLDVPIMVLVQLNRENKSESEDYLPSKADIRESGAIAADSDVILIVHRKYRDDDPDPKALFIVDKNRGGQADKRFSMRCVLEKSMFKDRDLQNDESPNEEETIEDFAHELSIEHSFLDDSDLNDVGNDLFDEIENWELD